MSCPSGAFDSVTRCALSTADYLSCGMMRKIS
jgi:hypothetical protein